MVRVTVRVMVKFRVRVRVRVFIFSKNGGAISLEKKRPYWVGIRVRVT
jgi:hypothetical protein